jgi:hypothetical protein
MDLSKTKISIGLTSVITAGAFIWQAAVIADEYRDMVLSNTAAVAANAEAVQLLSRSLRLSSLRDELADTKRERRDTKVRMAREENPAVIDLLAEQVEELNDVIEDYQKTIDCLEKGGEICE